LIGQPLIEQLFVKQLFSDTFVRKTVDITAI
jgi:hypothetical protein